MLFKQNCTKCFYFIPVLNWVRLPLVPHRSKTWEQHGRMGHSQTRHFNNFQIYIYHLQEKSAMYRPTHRFAYAFESSYKYLKAANSQKWKQNSLFKLKIYFKWFDWGLWNSAHIRPNKHKKWVKNSHISMSSAVLIHSLKHSFSCGIMFKR